MLKIKFRNKVEWLVPTSNTGKVPDLLKELSEKTEVEIVEGKKAAVQEVKKLTEEDVKHNFNAVKGMVLEEIENFTNEERFEIFQEIEKKREDAIILANYTTASNLIDSRGRLKDWRQG